MTGFDFFWRRLQRHKLRYSFTSASFHWRSSSSFFSRMFSKRRMALCEWSKGDEWGHYLRGPLHIQIEKAKIGRLNSTSTQCYHLANIKYRVLWQNVSKSILVGFRSNSCWISLPSHCSIGAWQLAQFLPCLHACIQDILHINVPHINKWIKKSFI